MQLNLSGVHSPDFASSGSPRGDAFLSPRAMQEFAAAGDSKGYAKHFYSEEEKAGLVDFLNDSLEGVNIDPKTDQIFEEIKKGQLLCNLLSAIEPNALARPPSPKDNPFEVLQNHSLLLEGAKKIGCTIVNVGPEDLRDGTPHLVLGVFWQIVRHGLLKRVQALSGDTLGLPPEQILLQWTNFHLKNAGYSKTIMNFSSDLKDGEALLLLLNQLSPNVTRYWRTVFIVDRPLFQALVEVVRSLLTNCSKDPIANPDPTYRAEKILEFADKLGCKKFVSVSDITSGNGRMIMAFLATLFTAFPDMGAASRVKALEAEMQSMRIDIDRLRQQALLEKATHETDNEAQRLAMENLMRAQREQMDIEMVGLKKKYETTIDIMKRTFQNEMDREKAEAMRAMNEMQKKLAEVLERERKIRLAIMSDDMQGFLWKKGKDSGKMQKRLFFLRGEMLLYFREAHDLSKPHGCIYIVGVKVSMLDEITAKSYSGSSKYKNGFELHSVEQNRVYFLAADNEDERKIWMNAIKENQRRYAARKNLQEALGGPGSGKTNPNIAVAVKQSDSPRSN